MLGFIIPLKPMQVSGNWKADCLLLENTLQSLLHQTDDSFRIYVVYSDMPEVNIKDARLQYIRSPYPFLKFEEMLLTPDVLEFHKSTSMIEKRFDKGKKLTYGSRLAKEDGCNYLMAVDADDLISNRIVSFVKENNSHHTIPGWYIQKGYIMNQRTRRMIWQNNIHLMNGSTHILRSDLVDIPEDATAGFHDYSLFTAHGWIKERLAATKKVRLEALPFAGVIYMVHHNNISGVAKLVTAKNIKNIIKNLLRNKHVGQVLRTEFTIGN